MPLLEINDLTVRYALGGGRYLTALNSVCLAVEAGESVGLVGESGSGKSTLAQAVVRLVPVSGGAIHFAGLSVPDLRGAALKNFRTQVQMVFQDPYGSLNPRLTVGAALDEVLLVHRRGARRWRQERIAQLLDSVGLEPDYARRYPHELSGGQRQRVGIARALALAPQLVIADEPVSALDVSVQAQILALMRELQQQRALAWLLIAHDLAVVRYLCRRVYVIYQGRIMEAGPVEKVFEDPAHPYTRLLLAAVPDIADAGRKNFLEAGREDAAGTAEAVAGCPFSARCQQAMALCRTECPPWREQAGGRGYCCHVEARCNTEPSSA